MIRPITGSSRRARPTARPGAGPDRHLLEPGSESVAGERVRCPENWRRPREARWAGRWEAPDHQGRRATLPSGASARTAASKVARADALSAAGTTARSAAQAAQSS